MFPYLDSPHHKYLVLYYYKSQPSMSIISLPARICLLQLRSTNNEINHHPHP